MELRQAFEETPGLAIVWVLPGDQLSEKSLRFVDGLGMRERIHFAVDPHSAAIDTLGVRKPDPEPIEQGVPHPTTFLLDSEGVVRFVDVRRDYHFWLSPELVRQRLAELH